MVLNLNRERFRVNNQTHDTYVHVNNTTDHGQ